MRFNWSENKNLCTTYINSTLCLSMYSNWRLIFSYLVLTSKWNMVHLMYALCNFYTSNAMCEASRVECIWQASNFNISALIYHICWAQSKCTLFNLTKKRTGFLCYQTSIFESCNHFIAQNILTEIQSI